MSDLSASAAIAPESEAPGAPCAWIAVADPVEAAICREALAEEGYALRVGDDPGRVELAVVDEAAMRRAGVRRACAAAVAAVFIVPRAGAGHQGGEAAWPLTRPVSSDVLRAYARAVRRLERLSASLADSEAELQRRRDEDEADETMARQVLQRLHRNPRAGALPVDTYVAPAATFSGDVVLTEAAPGGRVHLLLADGVGHGLAAALTVLPVTRVFYTMTRKGFGLSSIVAEIGQVLGQYLPTGRFVAMTFVAFDAAAETLEVWNAGNPDALLVSPDGVVLRRFPSRALAVGILPLAERDVVPETHVLQGPAQLVAFSDGLIEAAPGGGPGGAFGLRGVARAMGCAAPKARHYALIDAVRSHLRGRDPVDDISFAIIDCRPGEQPAAAPSTPPARAVPSVRTWRLSLELGPEQLRRVETVPVLQHFLAQLDLDGLDSPKLHLVLSELFNNALDHGLLRLDSGLKEGVDGMTAYLDERRARLEHLASGTLRIAVVRMERAAGVWLKVLVADSGEGFDYRRHEALAQTDAAVPHGRGIRLVRAMCDAVEYRGCGNEVEVHLTL